MRPEFIPDASKNDEDIFSDEEIDMETVELDALLRTHVGSTREAGTDATLNEANEAADDQKKQDAMNKSDEYWKPGRTCQNMDPGLKQQRRMNRDYSEDVLKQLKKEVARSQSGGEHNSFMETSVPSSCQESKRVSGDVFHSWLAGLNPDSAERKKRCNPE